MPDRIRECMLDMLDMLVITVVFVGLALVDALATLEQEDTSPVADWRTAFDD